MEARLIRFVWALGMALLAAGWQTAVSGAEGTYRLPVGAPMAAGPEDLPPIGTIQGSGAESPQVNDSVTFRGVVTGLHEDRNAAGTIFYTLFVQDLPGHEDGDPATSDGIAVFLGRKRPLAQIGDQVRVTGSVIEFFGLTEIDDAGLKLMVEDEGVGLPLPQPLLFDQLESQEGMLVRGPAAAVVIGPTFSGCGFTVRPDDGQPLRLFRHTGQETLPPLLPVLHFSDVDCGLLPNVKFGDRIEGLVGPLTYNFDAFKMVVQQPEQLQVTAVPFPPLPILPPLTADAFSIASFNMENYFDTVDDTGTDEEPKPTAEELTVQQTKLGYALSQTLGCPTLVAVQEVEKADLLHELATAVAPSCGFTYEVTHRESADVRGIDLALLSDPRRVAVERVQLRQTCTPFLAGILDPTISCPGEQNPLFSRPPLQVDLFIDGRAHTIIVNHFKSKREGDLETAPQRLLQAQHINVLADELLGSDPQARLIVLGDFNDYDASAPLLVMTEGNGRLTNALRQLPDVERYSFVFAGVAQLIDGILLSPALLERITAVVIQHTNADFPDSLGQDTSPAGLPYRATDHDLPLLVLSLADLATPIPTLTAVPPAATAVSPALQSTTLEPGVWGWLLLGAAIVGLAAFFFMRR